VAEQAGGLRGQSKAIGSETTSIDIPTIKTRNNKVTELGKKALRQTLAAQAFRCGKYVQHPGEHTPIFWQRPSGLRKTAREMRFPTWPQRRSRHIKRAASQSVDPEKTSYESRIPVTTHPRSSRFTIMFRLLKSPCTNDLS
jgi:hypothetical protein